MAVGASSCGGGYRTGISLDFRGESLETFVCGLAMYFRQHFVLEIGVLDTGNAS